ncbi:MAG: LacI family DNA-binding transcriptional regulator [Victivallales bacterium]|jgi:DNA-binding LacI/PurR family transcriptional regulator
MGVSIVEVARRAKVSRMTVTRVMRNDPVREETRKRVLESMRELSYVPSLAARAMRSHDTLRSSRATCFALVFGVDTQKADEFFCEVTRGVEKQAAEFGLCALQVHWLEDVKDSWLRMQAVLSIGGLCGVILAGQFRAGEIRSIQKVNPNIVIVDSPVPPGVKVPGVESDNIGGCRLAFKHLLQCKVKNPVVLAGPKEHYFSKAIAGALCDYRRQFESVRIFNTDYSMESARKRINRLVEEKVGFDAVFGNDTLCVGAMRALAEHGMQIPLQVKVVGFDDIPACQYLSPSLTSVHIDKQSLGGEAVKMLVALVRDGKMSGSVKLPIKAVLKKRETT